MIEQDESWFLRFIPPNAYMWMLPDKPIRLVQRPVPRKTPDRAITCFGGWCEEDQQVYLDFANGYPNSEQMWGFIIHLLALARQKGKRVLVLIWDNAPWHTSKRIKAWIRLYNREAKRRGEVRLLVHWLPLKSPWLNPIEPRWGHAKKHVCEPSGKLEARELKRRICAYFQTQPLAYTFNPLVPT